MGSQELTKTKWVVDPTHSEVQFKVKHLVISTVTGHFTEFSGSIESDEDFANADVHFEIAANSISTNNADRDTHLKSDDFFGAETFPKLTFRGSELNKSSSDTFKLVGELTIKEVTKTIELDVEHGGVMVDPYNQTKAGFEVTGQINRKDFGLEWSAVTEAGGVVVGDNIKIQINIQFIKQ